MSSYIQSRLNNHQGKINNKSVDKEIYNEVKNKVTIPMYFYNIILPQMGSYYDNYPVDFNQKVVVCCPLHSEDTPSFRFYEETSSFYCFGCQKGGDVIQLHVLFAESINGVKPSREEAAHFIYNYFIKGKEAETFIVSDKLPEEKINTDKEIVKFNIYRVNLEKSITNDRNIKLDAKKKIWEALDNIDILISKGMIKVLDARKYIEEQVKNAITPNTTVKEHRKIYDTR